MVTNFVKIGKIGIGGKHPIVVQSMCNTDTSNVGKTVAQIRELEEAHCELIRVAVPDIKSAKAIKEIKKRIHIPLVADIHYDYRLALAAINSGADKIRINPGNLKSPTGIIKLVKKAKQKNIPIRVGVNGGSLSSEILKKFHRPSPEALVEQSLENIRILERLDFKNIVISLKHSDVLTAIKAYRLISKKVKYPLHLGVTEAGTLISGTVKSAIAFGTLLNEGIGDTFRVSLSADPVEEIAVAYKILEALNIKKIRPEIISCPTCARTSIDVLKLTREVEKRIKEEKKPLKIAIMGCLVNGPGEAREADLGICGIEKEPGYLMFFKKGKLVEKFNQKEAVERLVEEIRKF